MSSTTKADKKATLDAASWMFNVVTSVGIIIVNKALMATYGFSFATTLTGLHFATTTILTVFLRWLGYIQPSHLPVPELVKFVIFANFSIVGMNVSLMWNSVGFYQIAKLSMIPVSCFLEVVLDKVRYSRDTKLSIVLVLLGVAVCTVTDVSVNAKGFIAAFIAVWSTALQQYVSNPLFNPLFLHINGSKVDWVWDVVMSIYFCMYIIFKGSILLDLSTFWGIQLLHKRGLCCWLGPFWTTG
ncbi:hypothetical protein Patl1_27648 [Pistacia atlantica]|uniref:Uncharacterized protein n=1 Tax=Pistacia atlantica TaxID=434234 RepID=A0ACC1BFH4_9ROSI|nr:hypothetical protein Patl1_27648 [Pistacia atlantica]